MFRKVSDKVAGYYSGHVSSEHIKRSVNSYLGVLSHAAAYNLSKNLKAQGFIAGEAI